MPFRDHLRKHGRALECLVLCGSADVDPAFHPQARRPKSKSDSLDAVPQREESRRTSTWTAGSEEESSGEGTVIPSEAPHLDPPGSPLSSFRASTLFNQATRHPQTGERYSFLGAEYAPASPQAAGLDGPARTRHSRAVSHRSSVTSALSYTPSAKSHRRAPTQYAQTQALRLNDRPAVRGRATPVELKKALPPLPRDSPFGSISAMLGEPRRR
ncbi:hypothetical protein JCM8208_002980 [Rhodotorula glutinis]